MNLYKHRWEKKFRFLTFNDDTKITRYLHTHKKRRQERTKNAKNPERIIVAQIYMNKTQNHM